jgi:putative nucleotidyltransferase with HDIG domain
MKKLLIVDDNPQNLYLLEVLLKTHGYEVAQAFDGNEALELARKTPPEMIISDILMPGMDGFSLCRACKEDERLKNIPFIFYTATYTDPKDEAFALSLGAERFIVKPMEPNDFIATMEEIIHDYEVRGKAAPPSLLESEDQYYKEYNETLIRKLEDKMMQIQQTNKRLASFYEVSCDLATIKQVPELIHNVLRALIETAGYQQVSYFEFDDDKNQLYLLDAFGVSDELLKSMKDRFVWTLGDEQSLVGLAANNKKIINVPDTSGEPRWIVHDKTINSALYIPVLYEKQLRGVVVLCSIEKDAFAEEDERNIVTLTNSLAIAIENKKNQEQVQKQLERLSALHSIDLAIKGSTDLHAVLNIFLDYVIKQLKIDAVDVLLYNSAVMSYEFAAGRGFNTRAIENHDLRQGKSLTERVILERRIIQINRLAEMQISPAFAKVCAAEGFVMYFGAPLIVKGEVKGVLEVFHRTQFTPDSEWTEYFETLAGQAAIAIDNAELFDGLQRSNIELRLAYDATIEGWSRVVDLRDKETEGHAQRVAEITLELARSMEIANAELIHIRRGALLHDIGKIGVPDAILFKPGPLNDEEWAIMRKHPQYAYDILSPINYLQKAMDIPYCHHEKWDGSGYPRGMKGERIPIAARLFAVVDVWDALRSDRPYRKAWQEEAVLDYLQEQAGKHFDPKAVNMFLNLLRKKAVEI